MKTSRDYFLGVRLTQEEKDELDQVVNYYQISQSGVIRRLIKREYQKIKEDIYADKLYPD